MRVFHQHGSKERLFEMVQKVNGIILKEEFLPSDDREKLLVEFVKFAAKELGLKTLPKITLITEPNAAKQMKTFGKYDFDDNELDVVWDNRNLADIFRTLGHELVHHKQNIKCGLNAESGETGSKEENEANEKTGVLLREFGKSHPEIFE